MLSELTRRKFMSLLAALHWMMSGQGYAADNTENPGRLPIHDLNLPAEELRDLETFAAPVIAAARRLDDLNLGNLPIGAVEPGFVFYRDRAVVKKLQEIEHSTEGVISRIS